MKNELTTDPATGKALQRKDGKRVNESAWRRAEDTQRAALIQALGMEPENGERYAATTGELARWAREGA